MATTAPLLHYRAGPRALRYLKASGLSPEGMRALIAPATGPKWLALAGFDRALLQAGFFTARERPARLIGASAGAWRTAALACPDPLRAHRALAEGYIGQRFTRSDSGAQISQAYVRMLAELLPDAHVAHALAHPDLRLSVVTARARGPLGSDLRALQAPSMLAAAAAHMLSRRAQPLCFERSVFHSQLDHAAEGAPGQPADGQPAGDCPPALLADWRARHLPLTAGNMRSALMASGTVPVYMAPVRDLPDAPPGRYIDGGLTDYHVHEATRTGGDGIVLLLLHQRRIVPGWFDKFAPWRRTRADACEDLLQVFPDPSWVAALPGGQVPTRDDFITFLADPEERIRRWQTVVQHSEQLGQQLLSDLQAGRIPDLTQPL